MRCTRLSISFSSARSARPEHPEVALGAIVDGASPATVINEDIRRLSGPNDIYLERAKQRELVELERRRTIYLGNRAPVDPTGHTAIIVDDGLATGATAKAALIAAKTRGAVKVILAIPVAPEETLAEMLQHADVVVCVHPSKSFQGWDRPIRTFTS